MVGWVREAVIIACRNKSVFIFLILIT